MIIKQRSISCGFACIILLLSASSFKFSYTLKTSASQPDTILYTDHSNKRAVYLTANGTEPCRVYGHSETVQFLRKVATVVRQLDDNALQILIEDCHGHLLSRPKRESNNRLDFIYPGTKWCGPGNVATNYDDLGLYADTDQCCREHDLCPDFILAGECRHGLCNTSPFTRSHCNCDENFRQCLAAIDNTVSNAVGVAFFNVGNIVCFRNDYPIIGCLNFAGKRRRRQAQCNPQAQLWRFVSPAQYRAPGRFAGRSMVRGDSFAAPSRSTGVISSLHNLMDTVGDVSTVVRSVARAAYDAYRREPRIA